MSTRKSAAITEGPSRAPGPRHAEGGRLHRRRPAPADHRRGEHLDRDRALQLPPARSRRGGEGGHPDRRRDADGVQHGVDLRRHHDGQRGDEGVARQPRGGGRLHRAGRTRQSLRRHRDPGRLRQDHPRRGDGAGAARHSRPGALRRLDCARTVGRARRHDPGRVRGGRHPCRRQDDRRAVVCAGGRRLSGARRVRRTVHRQHDVDGLRAARGSRR